MRLFERISLRESIKLVILLDMSPALNALGSTLLERLGYGEGEPLFGRSGDGGIDVIINQDIFLGLEKGLRSKLLEVEGYNPVGGPEIRSHFSGSLQVKRCIKGSVRYNFKFTKGRQGVCQADFPVESNLFS